MALTTHKVRHWRGNRVSYEFLLKQNALDPWTRYSVIEPDKSITEYFGNNIITEPTGQILPVDSLVSSIDEITPLPYGRYLVGSDETGYKVYTAYIDEEANVSFSIKDFTDKFGVRIRDRGNKNYVLDGTHLVTYDDVDCGDF